MIKDTVAYCGLFCESCGVYIATKNKDQEELGRIAELLKTTKENIPCMGCRSDILSPHCRNCKFKYCARGREIDNCEQCQEFPCKDLVEFQKQMPHRAELFESTEYRNKHGIDKWLNKMTQDYSCLSCGQINSPYYVKCRKCGAEPGNPFIERNYSLFKK